jgi:hypothetical protein
MALTVALLRLGAAFVIAACSAPDEVENTTIQEPALTAASEGKGVSAEDD